MAHSDKLLHIFIIHGLNCLDLIHSVLSVSINTTISVREKLGGSVRGIYGGVLVLNYFTLELILNEIHVIKECLCINDSMLFCLINVIVGLSSVHSVEESFGKLNHIILGDSIQATNIFVLLKRNLKLLQLNFQQFNISFIFVSHDFELLNLCL